MSSLGFGLTLQRLGSDADRVLVAGAIVSFRSPKQKRFATTDVVHLFEIFHVPAPSNTSARLGYLREQGLVVRYKDNTWAVTPEGREKALQLVADLESLKLEPELSGVHGADLGSVYHATLPPLLAPLKWGEAIARLLDEHPFERNVFLMTRYPSTSNVREKSDPLVNVVEVVADALTIHGLHLHRADDRQLDDDLLGNVAAYMWACQYGIGLIEDRVGKGLNYNVVIELGAMLMTGRRCAFLRDNRSELDLPTDFVGQIYKGVDFSDLEKVSSCVHKWAALDLALGKCASCP